MGASLAGWIDRPESEQCCEDSPGPVGSPEQLARLLHSKIVEPDYDPLKRSEFFPPKAGFSNECGLADGSSVLRASALTEQMIKEKAKELAEIREGRTAQGAWIAVAGDLREIRIPDVCDDQLVFVYDDPLDGEPLHAVVRGSEVLSRPDQDKLRDLIRQQYLKNPKVSS